MGGGNKPKIDKLYVFDYGKILESDIPPEKIKKYLKTRSIKDSRKKIERIGHLGDYINFKKYTYRHFESDNVLDFLGMMFFGITKGPYTYKEAGSMIKQGISLKLERKKPEIAHDIFINADRLGFFSKRERKNYRKLFSKALK